MGILSRKLYDSSRMFSKSGFIFVRYHFCLKWKMFTFFSSSLPRFDKCHETSRIFLRTEQTFASARSFGVISWASFSRENCPFGFETAPSASQKALSKSKGPFLRETNALNDTKTAELSKSAEGNGEYLWSSVAFVEAWIKCNFPNGTTGRKTTQMLHKNKGCSTYNFQN